MRPSDLTVDVVRGELRTLIERFPDRTGSVKIKSWSSEEPKLYPACVYYTDGVGEIVTGSNYCYDDYEENTSERLVTPICIIGQWIDDFHPDYKEDNCIKEILLQNGTMRSLLREDEGVFPRDVLTILANAQDTQDDKSNTWKDIEL